MTAKCVFVAATAMAIAVTCVDLGPGVLAQEAITAQNAEVCATPRARRVIPPVPFEAFGALAGAVASIAAAEHQRETYYGPYYSPYHAPYGYEPYRRPPVPQASGRGPASPPVLVTRPAAGTL